VYLRRPEGPMKWPARTSCRVDRHTKGTIIRGGGEFTSKKGQKKKV